VLSREQFIDIALPCRHHRDGLPDWVGARGVATCFLTYGSGLWFPEIAALRAQDWCPSGERVVVVTGKRSEKRDAALATRPRRIPVSPAVHWAVKRYQQCAPKSVQLFSFADQDVDRGRTLKSQVTLALKRTGLATKGVKAGALRSSFETLVRARDARDGLVDYLIGSTGGADSTDLWRGRSAPIAALRKVLRTALTVWEMDRAFLQGE
jgi:site-specific recombinase XerC